MRTHFLQPIIPKVFATLTQLYMLNITNPCPNNILEQKKIKSKLQLELFIQNDIDWTLWVICFHKLYQLYETKQQNSKFILHYVLLIFQAQQNQILINKLQLKSQYSLSSAFSQLQNKDTNFQLAKTTFLSIFIHKYLAKQTVTIQENWEKNFQEIKKKTDRCPS